MPAQKNLNGIFAKKLKQLDNSLDGFADVLNDVMNDLIIQMNGYVSAYRKGRELNVGELLKAVQAGQARDDIVEMLNQAGYGQLVNDFVDQYDEYTTEFLSRVFDEIDVPLSFTQADIELMDQLKGFDVQKALGVRDELAQGLSNGLAQMAMAGSSFTDTMAFMRTVPGAHAGHLKAQINTGMASFDAKIAGDKMVEAGIERYRYYGPVDSITRPFCRKVIEIQAERGGFTLEEIQGELTELRQSLGQAGGLAPDAFITRGGWNCRHSWGVWLDNGEGVAEKALAAQKKTQRKEISLDSNMVNRFAVQELRDGIEKSADAVPALRYWVKEVKQAPVGRMTVGGRAMYVPELRTIFFDPELMHDLNGVGRLGDILRAANDRGDLVANSIADLMIHEMGHAVHSLVSKAAGFQQYLKVKSLKVSRKSLSNYAFCGDYQEKFAEMFNQYIKDKTKLPKQALDYMEESINAVNTAFGDVGAIEKYIDEFDKTMEIHRIKKGGR